MAVRRFITEILPDGTLKLPPLRLEPGTEVEVLILDNGARLDDNPSALSSALAADTLKRLWDTPEEDEAWRGF